MTQPSPRQSLLFSRTLDGLEEWMEEVEGKLQSLRPQLHADAAQAAPQAAGGGAGARQGGEAEGGWKLSHMAEDMF